MVYRVPFVPETDEEIEALTDLSQRVRRIRLWTVVPLILLTALAMVFAVRLHLAGGLPLAPLADGSYYVAKGSILIVAALSGGFTFGPGLLLSRAALWLTRRRWRHRAAHRYKLGLPTLDALESLFVGRPHSSLPSDPD